MLSNEDRKQAVKKKGREQRLKNFMFSGIDWSKVIAVAPDGRRFHHPK